MKSYTSKKAIVSAIREARERLRLQAYTARRHKMEYVPSVADVMSVLHERGHRPYSLKAEVERVRKYIAEAAA